MTLFWPPPLLKHIFFNPEKMSSCIIMWKLTSISTRPLLTRIFIADFGHRCGTRTQRLRQRLPLKMGETYHSQVSRRHRAGFHQVLEGRVGVQFDHSQEPARSYRLGQSTRTTSQRTSRNRLLRGWKRVRRHQAARSRR